jgi:DNA-binding GntR family transcriptional regulator
MQFHEFICIKAEHTRLLKAWHEQHAQSQMLLNIRFRAMPEYTPETVISDHTNILDALERRDAATANALTLDISRRVADECIVALRRTLR